ncbi:MAG TPA: hypothetical protein VH989_02560 [Actinomycetota bacterium]
MRAKRLVAVGVTAFVVGSVASVVAGPASGETRAAASFTTVIDNPLFPLPIGATWVYRGMRDGVSQTDRVTVTSHTKVVDGETVLVVRDVAKHGTRLLEKTFDWYAQDDLGAVWYFGEDTATYGPNGHVTSTEGSWTAGVDGALRGIIMEADPQVPDGYRQEYYAGYAEDSAWVLSLGNAVTVPYGRVHHVLRTMEWSPLEPDVVDQKYYARGIGIVKEVAVAGDQEVAKLVSFVTP